MIKSLYLIVMLSIFSDAVIAGEWEDRRSRLEKSVIYDQFRIFYSVSGNDGLSKARKIDSNRNRVPDFIESVGSRLVEADRFFRFEVGLTSPLRGRRYGGRAHYIDVNILDFSMNSKGPKNGVAYDGTPTFNRSVSGQRTLRVLAIDLSMSVRLKSNSVEHELFHLYQNGYTFFKNRWYTEGTARWSELIMSGRIGKGEELPKSTLQKEVLFNKTYDAKGFWNELIRRTDQKTLGKNFIRHLFEQLDYADDVVARKRGLSNKYWKESEQRSKSNNPYIWNAVMESVTRMGQGDGTEMQALRRL